ncbi:MAG: N-acetylmuramoyl-L-alanine amidase family protein [Clostridia bacterium]
MNKIRILLLLLLFLFSMRNVMSAGYTATLNEDRLLVEQRSASGEVRVSTIDILKAEGYDYLPIRRLSEAFNALVSWDQSTQSVRVESNDQAILFKNGSIDVHVNGTERSLSAPVMIREGISYASAEAYLLLMGMSEVKEPEPPVVNPTTGGISIVKGTGSDRITFTGGDIELISHFSLSGPDRIVLDLKNFKITQTPSEGTTFHRTRSSLSQDGVFRLVFDLNGKYKYTIQPEASGFSLVISVDGTYMEQAKRIEYRSNRVTILTPDYKGFTISRLSDPFRIVLHLPVALSQAETMLQVDESMVSFVRAYPSQTGSIVEIGTNGQMRFELERNTENLVVGIHPPVISNVLYHNAGDRKYIRMEGLAIAGTNEAAVPYYTMSTADGGKSVTYRFQDPKYLFKEGVVYVNDDFILQYTVRREGTWVYLTITAKDVFEYVVNCGPGYSHINIIRKAKPGERIVVIDPGHGGRDPGAMAGDIREADLNLKISILLRDALEDQGIRTYMIRSTDEFVGLFERTDIANALGGALFLSIHCNTLNDRSYSGIMTLAFPGTANYSLPNGKLFATIVHEETLRATGANDAGIRDRDKLVVLRKTLMPAVVMETGFMTHAEELQRLIDPDYQERLARGMANAVEKMLQYMK